MKQTTRHINGYTVIRRKHDPSSFKSGANSGFKYKHRVVAERSIRRKLSDTEVVHHINGNKSDNSPKNLLVLTNSEHVRLHRYLKSDQSISKLQAEEQLKIAKTPAIKTGTCSNCGGICSAKSKLCKKCARESRFKPVTEEFREELKSAAEASSVSSVARRLGVSDHTVTKIISGKSSYIRKDRELLPEDPAPAKQKTISDETKVSLRESLSRYWKDRPSPDDIAVVELDDSGNVIAEFRSARDAQRKTGLSNSAINQCCHGKRKTYGGHVWKFKHDM